MVVKEFYKTRDDGVNLYRSYSNKNLKIKQVETGAIFDEAIDIEGMNYTYIETEEYIEQEEATEEQMNELYVEEDIK